MIFKLILGTQIHIVKSNDKQKYMQFIKILPTLFKHLPKRYILSYFDQDGDQITFEDQSDYQVLFSSGLKTAKINIRELTEEIIQHQNQVHIDKAQQEIIQNQVSEIKEYPKEPEQQASVEIPLFEESVIEDKLKKLMPEIISKIKNQISSELKEKSNLFLKKQIKEEKKIQLPQKKEQQKQNGVVIHEDITCDGCNQQGIIGIRYKCTVCRDFDFCQKCEATIEHNHPFLKIKTLKQTPVKIFAIIQPQEIKKPSQEQKKPSKNGPELPSPSIDKLVHQGLDIVKGYFNGESQQQLREKCQVIKGQWKKKTNEWKNAWTEQNSKEQPKKQAQPIILKKEEEKPKVQKKEQKLNIEIKPKVESNLINLNLNANYLVNLLGFNFNKSLKLAQQFPSLTKEQLLNYCLSQPELFQ